MYSEANRRETFTSWPHVGYRWAQPDPMAQAGFYHQVRLLPFMNFKCWQLADSISPLLPVNCSSLISSKMYSNKSTARHSLKHV